MGVLIRTDGGATIGTGHVMRMMALAERCPAVRIACAELDVGLAKRLDAWPVVPVSARPGSAEDAAWVLAQPEPWVVADGYQFGAEFQDRLLQGGKRLLLVDDFGHARRYSADLVLNQNLSAHPALYDERSKNVELLLGPEYALIRREFRRRRTPVPDRVERVLVTMGGADPDNVTQTVLDALRPLSIEVRAVAGPSNPHRLSGSEIVRNADMPALMGWADLAITAGGITTYELAMVGVPMLLVIVADNQDAAARALDERGVGRLLGRGAELSADRIAAEVGETEAATRTRWIAAGHALVDGGGAERIIERMEELT